MDDKPVKPVLPKVCPHCGLAVPEYRFVDHVIDCAKNVKEAAG
jgi:hypothetical protein